MKFMLILLAAATVASGIQYNGLRVKFGWSDALANKEYFFNIPRTTMQAESEGWRRIERPPGPLPELRLYCSTDRYVCPLFDAAGFVAGLQIALPVDEFESPAMKPEKRFIKWRAPATETEPARDYWTATQYYVSEESLKAGAGPQVENGATLQDGGVWVSDLEGQLIRIPSTEGELNTTLFKKQNCIPNMGTHYHWNMTRDTSCDDLLPWFALTTNGDLVGVGFQFFGSLSEQPNKREWFEKYKGRDPAAFQMVVPFAPDCYLDNASKYDGIGLHIYFIDDPWNIRCLPGDSIKPAAIIDRIKLTGHRYASKVYDEVKSIFT
ncbi:uncharacterized protein LOC123699848 isoform X1 [Colias croceus]|uniref:uncharacterized protein LOC123699848 isoform X1 n=1 Tax=Colias crocea TaxID=72248 RepID=UPI001E27DDA6|nr:uncharacterized protein LOC123699848 isoform X1 [Colias croceus]